MPDIYDQLASESPKTTATPTKAAPDVYDQLAATTPMEVVPTVQGNTDPTKGMLAGGLEMRPRVSFDASKGVLPNVPGFVKNVAADLQDLTQGMTAMGSEAMARGRAQLDGVPMIHTPKNRERWEHWEQGRKQLPVGTPVPDDLTLGTAMGGAMVQDFKQKYVDPGVNSGLFDSAPVVGPMAMGLRGGKPADPAEIMKYPKLAYEHPVESTLDVPFLPGAGAVAKGIVKAGKAVGVGKLIPQNLKAVAAATKVFKNADKNFKAWASQTEVELTDLYNRIPPDVQERLIPGAEQTDDAAVTAVASSPEAQAFLAKVREYNAQIKGKAIQHGYATEDDFLKGEYGPSLLAGNPNLKASDLDAYLPQLRAMQASTGQTSPPTYFGLIYKDAVKDRPGSMLNDFAKGVQERPDTPGFLEQREAARAGVVKGMTTIRTKDHSMNALAVARKRIEEGYRFFALKDAIDDLLTNPAISGVQNGVPFDANAFLQRMGAAAGMNPGKLPLAQSAVMLPKSMVQYLDVVSKWMLDPMQNLKAGANSWTEHPFYKIGYQKPAQILKRWLLGYDPSWPAIQAVQGGMMFAGHAFEGPQHFLSSTMAAAMSLIPQYRGIVPKELLADFNAMTRLPTEGNKWANAAKNIVDFIPDKLIYPATNMVDNQFRIAGAIYEALKRNGWFDAPTPTRLKAVIENNHDLIVDAIHSNYGDFTAPQEGLGKIANDTIMFMPWLKAAGQIGGNMVMKHPFKTSAMSQAAQVAPQFLQDDKNTSSYMYEGGAVPYGPDPQGNPTYMWKPGFVPYTQPLQSAQQLIGYADPNSNADPRGASWNPLIQQGASHLAPMINRKIKYEYNPTNMVEMGNGEYITQKQFEEMRDKDLPQKPIDWRPSTEDLIASGLFPRQTMYAERIKEFPGLPSDESSLMGPRAPKREGDGAIRLGIHGKDFNKMLFEYGPLGGWGRFAPTQSSFSKEQEDRMRTQKRIKTIFNQAMKTRNWQDIADILSGEDPPNED